MIYSCGLKMRLTILTFWAVLAVAVFFLPALSHGKTYKYVDEKGQLHLTDRKETIPGEYLDQIETVDEDHSTAAFNPIISDKVNNEYRGARSAVEGELDMLRLLSAFASTNPGDIKTSVAGMKYAMLLIFVLTIFSAVLIFKYVKPRVTKYLLLVLLVLSVYAALYNMFRHQLAAHLETVAVTNTLSDDQKAMLEMLLEEIDQSPPSP